MISPLTDAREKPNIIGDIDRPFSASQASVDHDSNAQSYQLNEQTHNHEVENYKNVVGGILLAVCFSVIIGFSIADAVCNVQSPLFPGAVEFSKTIATAVLGYLFGTNLKNNNTPISDS